MRLQVVFQEYDQTIQGTFSEEESSLHVEFDHAYVDPSGEQAEKYNGPYEITPRIHEQSFETAQKLMIQDLTVLEIPYAPVANDSGGVTVTIGGI